MSVIEQTEGIVLADIIDTIDMNNITSLNNLSLLYSLEGNEEAIKVIARNVLFLSLYLSNKKNMSAKTSKAKNAADKPSWLERTLAGLPEESPEVYYCGKRIF